MSQKARQMPDGNYSFGELRDVWNQGTLTLEECMTQTLYTMIRFEARKAQLDLKLLQFRMAEWDAQTWQTFEELREQVKSEALLEAMQHEKKNSYETMDFILDHGVMLEMKLIQAERRCEEMLRKLDETASDLN